MNSERLTLEVDGLSLSFLHRPGPVGKPALVLLHGLIAEAEVFHKLVAQLPDDRRIIAIDLPGAGYSGRPTTHDVSFEGATSLLRRAFTQLGLERPILLGHSHGGALALHFAAHYPDDLTALILMCPAHPFSGHEEKLIRFYLSRAGRWFARGLPHLPRQLHMQFMRRMPGRRGTLNYEDLAPYLHTIRRPGTVAHLLRLLETWTADMAALRLQLEQTPITLPTMVLWGDRDIVVPHPTAFRLLKHLSNYEMFTLPGVGHLPNEEAPRECAGLIRTWLIWLETHPKYRTWQRSRSAES